MMIPCNWYINVAKECTYPTQYARYEHFCKIELGDVSKDVAWDRWEEIKLLFRKEDGFKLDMYYVRCSGQPIANNYIDENKK